MSEQEANPPRTVIILGAGASKADGAPLQGELFAKYFHYYRSQPFRRQFHQWDRELATFFDGFFGIDVDDDDHPSPHFPTFEEVLGVLEIANSQDESFRDWGTSHIVDAQEKPSVQHIREVLVFLIAETLDQCLRSGSPCHERLLQNLRSIGWLPSTTFISLNYDILIDNALLNLHPAFDLDYHVDFTNVQMGHDMPESEWHKPRQDHSALLLKLHGSLNWLYCPTCRTLDLTPKEKGVCKLKWHTEECLCTKCRTLAVPIIIPPTYFKVLSNLYLRQIWDRADRELTKADRVVFCGYSFPDADMHLKYLLKRAEVNRPETEPGPEVFVVNDHRRKRKAQRLAEKERYVRFFRDRERIHFVRLSFQRFAERPDLIEDESRWL